MASLSASKRTHAQFDAATSDVSGRLNWLRAGVLGANDGIVSTAGLVIGVAGATTDRSALLMAGVAGLAAGAMSMGVGEYVSVSTQRDTETSLLNLERQELLELPEQELRELAGLLQKKGMSKEVARQAAVEMTAHDALAAHADIELGIDPAALSSPVQAALASAVAFTVGALIPLLAILLAPAGIAVGVTVVAVVLALMGTGITSARLGHAPMLRATARNVLGGLLAMGITFWIGRLVGTAI
jgi:vacuolar iron transporter family protein